MAHRTAPQVVAKTSATATHSTIVIVPSDRRSNSPGQPTKVNRYRCARAEETEHKCSWLFHRGLSCGRSQVPAGLDPAGTAALTGAAPNAIQGRAALCPMMDD
jgi:hypothetical protein